MRILFLPNSYSQQRQKEKVANIYPVLLAMQATYLKNQGHEVIWNQKGVVIDVVKDLVIVDPKQMISPSFLSLPRPDRVFTRAKEFNSGNYKYLPGTHSQVASGCWHGKCTFCVENKGQAYEVRSVEDYLSEIEECKALGFKEVFDDSATFPLGEWLDSFIIALHSSNAFGITLGCNCRVASYPFMEMRRAGFRMCLFGIESANQYTLDKINKGVKVEEIIPTIKRAAEAGLEPHIAVMFGYPWETDEDAIRTLRLVHYLLRKGYAKTAQASLYCPQDGIRNEAHKKYVKKIYNVGFDPRFWFTVLRNIRTRDDIKYIWRGIQAWLNI